MILKNSVTQNMFLKPTENTFSESYGFGTKPSNLTNVESVGAPTGQAKKHFNAAANG